jgi:hypothetical protein
VPWRGRASQVVDLVYFEDERLGNIVPNQVEVWPIKQMGDVRFLAGEEIIDANDIVTVVDETFAEMRA